jgi:hypothetical protein
MLVAEFDLSESPLMPWPRPKFTNRRIMVIVAVAALVLGGVRWHRWAMARRLVYQRIAIVHDIKGARFREAWVVCPHGELLPSQPESRKAAYHEAMEDKYKTAANYPWFPVPPDPPEP